MLAFSFFIHLIFLSTYKSIPLSLSSELTKPPIKVEQISQEQLEKYRRVGVRNGVKRKSFSMKTPPAIDAPNKETISPTAKDRGQKTLDLKNLAMGNSKEQKRAVQQRVQNKIREQRIITYRKKRQREMLEQQQEIQQRLYQNIAPGTDAKKLLGKSGFNLKFEPVEGVSEDELNPAEKIFFSFQKRTFERYYLSFVKSYNNLILQKPLLKNALMNGGHLLTGEIRFDKEGNIVRIRILQSSKNDDIHRLFEQTLKSIGKMPNPPEAFIKNKDQFSIFYQLQIK